MGQRLLIAMGLFLGVALTLPALEARQKDTKNAPAKQDRIDGIIQLIDKPTKTVTVRLRDKQQQQQVIYDDKTAFTFQNKPATLDEVRDGRRIIALGKINDKNQLIATRIDVRDKG
jgi:cytochrome c-type biogenesis protein CcmE